MVNTKRLLWKKAITLFDMSNLPIAPSLNGYSHLNEGSANPAELINSIQTRGG